MKCPRCGSVVAPGLVACPRCGMSLAHPGTQQSVAMPAGAAAISKAYDDQQKRGRRTGITAGVVLLVALFGLAAVKGFQALGFGGSKAEQSLVLKGQMPDTKLLVAQTGPSEPVMSTSIEQPKKMPKDVFDWLEHLRKTEEARVGLTTTQLSKAMTEYAKSQVFGGVDSIKDLLNGIDDPNKEMKTPTDELYPVLKELHDQSRVLIDQFDSYPPPTECQPIYDAYFEALSETTGMLGDISDNLKSGDVNKLLNMKGTSPGAIDANANKADRLVGEICEKYDTRRWFSIKGDIGSDGVMGMPKL